MVISAESHSTLSTWLLEQQYFSKLKDPMKSNCAPQLKIFQIFICQEKQEKIFHYIRIQLLVEKRLINACKGTEVWIWKQFNKTKPDSFDWNVTLSKDNYNLLIDAITTVARDTGF